MQWSIFHRPHRKTKYDSYRTDFLKLLLWSFILFFYFSLNQCVYSVVSSNLEEGNMKKSGQAVIESSSF